MKIGIDVDDVLADSLGAATDHHNENFGTKLKHEQLYSDELWKSCGISKEEMSNRLLGFINKNILRLKVIDGAKASVARLSREHELVALTGRSAGMLGGTKKWIELNFPRQFSEVIATDLHFVNGGVDKGQICKEKGIGLFVDDFQGYVMECHRAGIPAIIFDQPWNKKFELPEKSCWRAENWEEAERIIKKINKANE